MRRLADGADPKLYTPWPWHATHEPFKSDSEAVLLPGRRGCAWLNAAVHPIPWLVAVSAASAPLTNELRGRMMLALVLCMIQAAAEVENAAAAGVERGISSATFSALDPGIVMRFVSQAVAAVVGVKRGAKEGRLPQFSKALLDKELKKSKDVKDYHKEYLLDYVRTCAALQYGEYTDPFHKNRDLVTLNHISSRYEGMTFRRQQDRMHPLKLISEFFDVSKAKHKEFVDSAKATWEQVASMPLVPAPVRQNDMAMVLFHFGEKNHMVEGKGDHPLSKWLADVFVKSEQIEPSGRANLSSSGSEEDELDQAEEGDTVLGSLGAGRPPHRLSAGSGK